MSYCINPSCTHPDDQEKGSPLICRHCGSDLLLQGRFQVMRLISNKSGFGDIYEAYERTEPKILKVLKPQHNQNQKVVDLFYQEGRVLSQLYHPGIPRVELGGCFQFFPKDSFEPLHCLIMEKIEGINLAQWLVQQGNQPISEPQAINWLRQLANILKIVHHNNYFHRDIKPQNIMIRPNGSLVLIDFGTAREMSYTYLLNLGTTQGVTKISSVGYTPPEQEKGYAVSQSDFFALGRTFVYLMTGKSITNGILYDPLRDELHWHQYARHISPVMLSLIDKMMAAKAADRPQNSDEILEYLDKIESLRLSGKLLDHSCSPTETTYLGTEDFTQKIPAPKKLNLALIICLIMVVGAGSWQGFIWLNNSQQINHNYNYLTKLTGHSSYVNKVIFSHDGKNLISAGADRTIKIWNLETNLLIRTLTGHQSYVNAIIMSHDGQFLISGSADKTIKVWDKQTGEILKTLTGHDHAINDLILSSDNRILISASADKTIKIWDLETGKTLKTLTGHSNYINGVTITPDSSLIISASADQTIKIWDLSTGAEIRTLRGHNNYVNDVVVTPDGKKIISGSADQTIKVWDLDTGKVILTIKDISGYVNHLEIHPDGETLASGGSDKMIRFWNLKTGKEIGRITGYSYPIQSFTLSPDWHFGATGSGDRAITLWQLKL